MSLRKVLCVRFSLWLPALILFICSGLAASQDVAFQVDSQHSSVNFTLADVLHTVRGSFQLKQGELKLDAISKRLSGELIVDAKSGQSGNGMRDRKMHREVLESERYPEIVFRPDRIDGALAPQGKSSVRVHGVFSIHGADHEITVPADVDLEPDHWNATLHFSVPYANWGMKNPSTLFLRVSGTVDIDVTALGEIVRR
jgi:polyisoprenoid-binding protein YceI